MQVNSVNNVSFGAKKAPKQDKNQYYRYVSQYHANDALRMSVGREVEDGKFKAATAATMLTGFFGTAASIIASSNIADKARTLAKSENVSEKAVNKILKQSKAANVTLLASAALLLTSSIIKSVNESRANKTANERGFLSEGDYRKIKSRQEAYDATAVVNEMHVR